MGFQCGSSFPLSFVPSKDAVAALASVEKGMFLYCRTHILDESVLEEGYVFSEQLEWRKGAEISFRRVVSS